MVMPGSTARWPSSPAAPPGIGLAISERLAADGLAVAVFDREGEAALVGRREDRRSRGAPALGVLVDVTDRGQIDAGVALVRAELGRPTVLVNNAGIHAVDPVDPF